jgi:hypothetical protein
MKRRDSPVQFDLLVFVTGMMVIVGIIPLIFQQQLMFRQARSDIESEMSLLTLSNLESANEYIRRGLDRLGNDLEAVLRTDPEAFSSEGLASSQFCEAVSANPAFTDTRMYLFFRDEPETLYWIGESSTNRTRLNPADVRTDSLNVILENPGRRFWIGQLPFFPTPNDDLWLLMARQTEQREFVLAVSAASLELNGFLLQLERRLQSRIYFITSDNHVFPHASEEYFSASFALRALSRSDRDRFVSFSAVDTDRDSGRPVDLLVHSYTDSTDYYTLVAVTRREVLVAGLRDGMRRTLFLSVPDIPGPVPDDVLRAGSFQSAFPGPRPAAGGCGRR